jgi:hypothetical protein
MQAACWYNTHTHTQYSTFFGRTCMYITHLKIIEAYFNVSVAYLTVLNRFETVLDRK